MLVEFCLTVIVVLQGKFFSYPHLDEEAQAQRRVGTCNVEQILEFWLSSMKPFIQASKKN